MAGMRQVSVSGVFLVGGSIVQALIAFAANLVLVRYLDPADFGRFAVVQAGAGLVLSLISFRVGTQILGASEAELTLEVRRRLFSVLSIETLMAGLITVIWLATTDVWHPADLLLVAAVLIVHWTTHDRTFFERSMRYGRLALIETGTSVAGHLLAIGLVVAGLGAATIYIREMFIALAGLAVLGGLRTLSFYRLCWPSWAEWGRVLRHVRGIWLDSMLEGSFQRLVLLAVNAVGGLTGAGLFYQANRLAVVPQQFLQPVTSRVLFTWLARQSDEDVRQAGCRKALLLLALPLGVAALVVWLWADPLVPMIFGAAWAPAAGILSALIGVILAVLPFEVLRSYAVAARRVRLLLLARLVQYAAFLLPLAPFWWSAPQEVERVAWALSASCIAAFLALAVLTLRRGGLR
jgi:O-antigen/teichoic acid export membrane protein